MQRLKRDPKICWVKYVAKIFLWAKFQQYWTKNEEMMAIFHFSFQNAIPDQCAQSNTQGTYPQPSHRGDFSYKKYLTMGERPWALDNRMKTEGVGLRLLPIDEIQIPGRGIKSLLKSEVQHH